jgi:hypothetical protein
MLTERKGKRSRLYLLASLQTAIILHHVSWLTL